ncbi:MAG: hypothetical protein ABSE95_16675 [Thermodesulfobacteriota bacterium]
MKVVLGNGLCVSEDRFYPFLEVLLVISFPDISQLDQVIYDAEGRINYNYFYSFNMV